MKICLLVFLAVASVAALQNAETKTIWDGVFTDQQASRGEQTYKKSCAPCHKDDHFGDSGTPALAGPEFINRFNGSSVDDILQTVRASMPQDAPDSLGTAAYVDLIAHLLKVNGAAPGAGELPQDRAALKQIRVTSPK
jgi:mono/diheme cytochrome c family protein